MLAERRPGDAILGEEGGASGDGELRWVIDPLDGTINFLFGIPQFAVSVACEDADGAIAGVVLDPVREETFAATRSGAPTLDGAEITGVGPRGPGHRAGGHRVRLRRRGARPPGGGADPRAARACATSAGPAPPRSISPGVACGRYDAYYERGVKPWDVAAGGLIAARAGLAVRDAGRRRGRSPPGSWRPRRRCSTSCLARRGLTGSSARLTGRVDD